MELLLDETLEFLKCFVCIQYMQAPITICGTGILNNSLLRKRAIYFNNFKLFRLAFNLNLHIYVNNLSLFCVYKFFSGHNICKICAKNSKKCPSCRCKYFLGRNYSLEKIAEILLYSCPYKNCTTTIKLQEKEEHLSTCW